MELWLINLWAWTSAHAALFVTASISIVTAIGLGSIFTAVISGKYQKDNTLRTMRSEWINELREDLASFAGCTYQFDRVRLEQKKAPRESDRSNKLIDDVTALRAEKNRLAHKIIMRLNPFEDDHIKLSMIVRAMNSAEAITYRSIFRAQAQRVFKREWDVIRKGPMNKKAQEKWSANWNEQLLARKPKLRRLREEMKSGR